MTIINIPIPNVNTKELNFFGDTETGLVNLNQVLDFINNDYTSPFRKKKKKLSQENIFRTKKFAEEAIALHCFLTNDSIEPIVERLQYDSRKSVINLIELGLTTIKTKKGKYGGTYVHLSLLLSIISNVDGYLSSQVKQVLIEKDILGLRVENKTAHKRLMSAISRNPKFKKNEWLHSNVGKLVKSSLDYSDINNLPAEVLKQRETMVTETEILIKNGYINSYPEVSKLIKKIKLNNIIDDINLSASEYKKLHY